MSRSPLPWDEYAIELGFTGESEILHYCFVLDCQPISWLADLLGVEKSSLRYRIRRMGIPLKGRGGPNHTQAAKRRWYLRARERGLKTELDLLKKYRWGYSSLAREIGISSAGVRCRLKIFGLIPATENKNSQKLKNLRNSA